MFAWTSAIHVAILWLKPVGARAYQRSKKIRSGGAGRNAAGDVIIGVDAAEVKDPRDLARKIAALGPHKPVDLRVIRDGKELAIRLRLGQLADAETH